MLMKGGFHPNVFPDASVVRNCEKNSEIQHMQEYYLIKTNQHFKIISVSCQDYLNSFQVCFSVWGFGFVSFPLQF